jgi:hypothetical protein
MIYSIMGVVMFGRERDQPGVLIELEQQCEIDVSEEQEVIKARSSIWLVSFHSCAFHFLTQTFQVSGRRGQPSGSCI